MFKLPKSDDYDYGQKVNPVMAGLILHFSAFVLCLPSVILLCYIGFSELFPDGSKDGEGSPPVKIALELFALALIFMVPVIGSIRKMMGYSLLSAGLSYFYGGLFALLGLGFLGLSLSGSMPFFDSLEGAGEAASISMLFFFLPKYAARRRKKREASDYS